MTKTDEDLIAAALLEDLERQNPDMQQDPERDTVWLSGGTTPQSCGTFINVNDLAEAVARAIRDRLEGRGGGEAELDAAEKEAAEIGERDGYERAIQDLDLATGGDGEFKVSVDGGDVQVIDVPAMKARIIERFAALSREGEGWREIEASAPKDQEDVARLVEFQSLLNGLRRDEGDSVTLCCDNPDFGGQNNAIECNGAWTDWKDRRFEGESLLDAVRVAARAKAAAPAPPSQGGE